MKRRDVAAVMVGLATCALGCARTDATPAKPQGRPESLASGAARPLALTAGDLEEARTALDRIYAAHFARGQRDARTEPNPSYTLELDRLVREDADAGAAQCGVGFLNCDPLTNAQDDVAGYTLGAARAQADTAVIPVRIQGYDAGAMTVALVRVDGRWKIANFIHSDWDMRSSLRRSIAELRDAPKVDCDAPAAGDAGSARSDTTSTPPSAR